MRKSFILHLDSLSVLDKLTLEQAGLFIIAIRNYKLTGEIPSEFWLQMALEPFINQFKRDDDKYEERAERNRINGSKGGRPHNPQEPKETQITQSVFSQPKKADNDNDSVSDNGSDSGNVTFKKSKPKKLFVPPTIDEVTEFVSSKGFKPEFAKTIFEYYHTADWKDSKGNQVKNWKQKILGVWLTGDKADKHRIAPAEKPQRVVRLF